MHASASIASAPVPRIGKRRVRLPGRAYRITWMTARRRPHFERLEAARAVVAAMRAQEARGLVRSMAWVLMPDHLHWLVQLEGEETVDAVLDALRSACEGVEGTADGAPLWADDYSVQPLSARDDIREISRDIVANPLRWGLAASLAEYPHWDAIWI